MVARCMSLLEFDLRHRKGFSSSLQLVPVIIDTYFFLSVMGNIESNSKELHK